MIFTYIYPNTWIAAASDTISVLIYISGLCHLCYSINQKLFRATLTQKDSVHTDSEANVPIIDINHRQIRMVTLIAKFSVLMSLFGMVTFINAGFAATEAILSDNALFMVIAWCIWMLDIMFGTLCVYLLFGMNDKEYRCLCKCCHWICITCSKRRARKSMQQEHMRNTLTQN